MNIDKLQNIAILGAAGKMGRGILFLNALYFFQEKYKPENKTKDFTIVAFDKSYKQLKALLPFTKTLLQKWAEKNIVFLRQVYAENENLISNQDMIDAFIDEAMAMVVLSDRIESTFDASLIFEAVVENLEIKTTLLSTIRQNNPNDPWYFTNTSAIPIKELNKQAKLKGNIIGCHFYNPPNVQRLIEVIELQNGNKELSEWVHNFGKSLGKIMIPSNDIAGFIGNGFFMRDIHYAIEKLNSLKKEFSFAQSVFIVDKISRDFLLRPMGIFQLVDYVGVDVCSFILKVMNTYISIDEVSLLLQLLEANVYGGQAADGSQKPGFFTYKRNRIVSVYDFDNNNYIAVDEVMNATNKFFDELPMNVSWRSLIRRKDKMDVIEKFFDKIKAKTTRCSSFVRAYMQQMKQNGEELVRQDVTDSAENVNKVLITGFYHLYGPINNYCKK